MTMAADDVSPFSAMSADDGNVQITLQSLALRVSQLGEQVESLLSSFESRIHHLSARLHSVEKRQAAVQEDEFQIPDTKRIKIDDFKIPISEQEISFMHSQLTGPVKDAIHELGRIALSDQDVALRFLRIGSDKSVATTTLHSKELEPMRDCINWAFLPVDVVVLLEHRFVKTVAKKVEHTKRKIRQNSSEDLLLTAKHGKTEHPFLQRLLERLMKGRDVGKCETTCSSLSTSNMSPNTAASTSDDAIFEAKAVFVEMSERSRSYEHPIDIQILQDYHEPDDEKINTEDLPKITSFT